MTLDELAAAVFERGGRLVLRDGRIRYYGPMLAADDPIRAGVREHRDGLIRRLTQSVRPHFEPGPPYFEQVGPNIWRETPWAAARCVYGDAELAPGDRLHCPAHAARFTERAPDLVEAVA